MSWSKQSNKSGGNDKQFNKTSANISIAAGAGAASNFTATAVVLSAALIQLVNYARPLCLLFLLVLIR